MKSARLMIRVVFGMLICMFAFTSMAETVTRDQLTKLNQQIEDVKADALDIANSMIQLNERYIFPEKSRVSLFVTFADGDEVSLDKISLKIDGRKVVVHKYKVKELIALQQGGAQRIYTGNVLQGRHLLEVTAADHPDDGGATDLEEFRFDKFMSPKVIEISIGGKAFGGHTVDIRE